MGVVHGGGAWGWCMGVVHGGEMGMHVGAACGVGWYGIGTWVWCLGWGEIGTRVGCGAVGWDEYVGVEGEKFVEIWSDVMGMWVWCMG